MTWNDSVSGKQITMTEDHRLTGVPERTRFMKMGMPLKDGDSRLYGPLISSCPFLLFSGKDDYLYNSRNMRLERCLV